MRKSLAIAWKELYTTYTDRTLLLIMLVTPLALATIIGLALGGFINDTSNDVPVRNIPVALVNLDEGGGPSGMVLGDIYVSALVEGADTAGLSTGDEIVCEAVGGGAAADGAADGGATLYDLTNTVLLDSAAAARAGVDAGEYAAAIIIPADFTARATPDFTTGEVRIEPVSVEVYASPARPIQAGIVHSIVQAITNQIATGEIAVAASIGALIDSAADPEIGARLQALSADPAAAPAAFACAFSPSYAPIEVQQQVVSGETAGEGGVFNPLIYFGATNAVFFMMFTARGGAGSLLTERRQWTLQRLIASPTPRPAILLGQMLGTVVNCIVQLIALFIALTLIGSVIAGELQFIWGRNIPAILLMIVTVSIAAAGLGALITGLARSEEQANVIGSAVIIVMGLLSGSFFPVQALESAPVVRVLPYLTINYWAVDAFLSLAIGEGSILLNVALLLGLGAVMFGIGWWAFNRQLDIRG